LSPVKIHCVKKRKQMEELPDKRRLELVTTFLKILSAVQVVASVSVLTLILFIVNPETLALAEEEIMMPGQTILAVAVTLLLLLTASGIVALYRVRYGWVFSFLVGTLVLLMAFLLGPGSITLTRMSFSTMMVLSLVTWAGAVVYYLWDLYT